MTEIVTGDNYDNGGVGRVGNWMQTFKGRQFWPMDPRPEEVHLDDIAHGIANACRYAGHCLRFYSVAEHSVIMSYIVPERLALTALLHDATEAYVVDVPRPLKPFLAGYKDIEDRVWRAIAARFDLPLELPAEIKEADNAMLLAEQRQNMAAPPADWCIPGKPADVVLPYWSPDQAEKAFLDRFRALGGA